MGGNAPFCAFLFIFHGPCHEPITSERLTADFLSLVSVERLTLFHLEVDFLLEEKSPQDGRILLM